MLPGVTLESRLSQVLVWYAARKAVSIHGMPSSNRALEGTDVATNDDMEIDECSMYLTENGR